MNQTLSDLQLKAQTTLLEDDRTRKHGIEVIEEDGTIILKGSVPSRKVKKFASSILRKMRGVAKVENKLEVKDDHKILEKILR